MIRNRDRAGGSGSWNTPYRGGVICGMEWIRTLVEAFVTLFVILDPPAVVWSFVALTAPLERRARHRAAYVSVAVAAGVLALFAVAGPMLFRYLSISVESLMVAGGLLLFVVALQMFLRGPRFDAADGQLDPAIVPIGTPLLAGPGAIVATLLLFESPGVAHHGAVAAGMALALVITMLVFRFAATCLRCMRPGITQFTTRVMALILSAFAVQMIVDAVGRWMTSGIT